MSDYCFVQFDEFEPGIICARCHEPAYEEKSAVCDHCGRYFCMSCWLETGIIDEDDVYVCGSCTKKVTGSPMR